MASLDPTGFVVVSGDDRLNPILAFSDSGAYDDQSDNPLRALLERHTVGMLQAADQVQAALHAGGKQAPKPPRLNVGKWEILSALGAPGGGAPADAGITDVDRMFVPVLMSSRWGQGNDGDPGYTYNLETPYHFPAGCTAVAMGQVMYFHNHPIDASGTFSYSVYGYIYHGSLAGDYDWGLMRTAYDGSEPYENRFEVSSFLFDCGKTIGMDYTASGSGAWVVDVAEALTSVFSYSSAIGENVAFGSFFSADRFLPAINGSLSAHLPAVITIRGVQSAHAIAVDGWGQLGWVKYHHLNMGWDGMENLWYNLEDPDDIATWYQGIDEMVYNVSPTLPRDSFIIAGRVWNDNGDPVSGCIVTAPGLVDAVSDTHGVYALTGVGGGSYLLSATDAVLIPIDPTGGWPNPVVVASANVIDCDFLAAGQGSASNEVHHFDFVEIPSPQGVDVPFQVTIVAKRADGTRATSFRGSAALAGFVGGEGKVEPGHGGSICRYPAFDYFRDQRTQVILLSSELGGDAGLTDLSLEFDSPPNGVLSNWTIRLKHTALNSFDSSSVWDNVGWTVVYADDEVITQGGWHTFTFVNPFGYNGTANLMIDFSYSSDELGTNSSAGRCLGFWGGAATRVLHFKSRGEYGDPVTWAGQTPWAGTEQIIPNIRLSVPRVPVPIFPPAVWFTSGSSDGLVTVYTAVQNMYLRVDDGDGHIGDSNLFSTESRGCLQVTMLPTNEPAISGAHWRLTTGGDTGWQTNGHLECSVVVAGSPYTVTFEDVLGWTTPPDEVVIIAQGATTTLIVSYTEQTGTMTVDVTPDEGPWTLTEAPVSYAGPRSYTGDWVEVNAAVGTYTIQYEDLPGHTTPTGESQVLTTGGTVDFYGYYTPFQGSISIDLDPDVGGWVLTGYPPGYVGPLSDTADLAQTAGPGGIYTVAYDPAPGYITPAPETQDVDAPGVHRAFQGQYLDTNSTPVGTIEIDVTPSNGTWTITSAPAAYGTPTSGTGDLTPPTVAPVGNYTVAYGDLVGYITPTQQTQAVVQGLNTLFLGNYAREFGQIAIVVMSNGIWNIVLYPPDYSGPTSGVGALPETNAPIGTYRVMYGDVPGYQTPLSETKDVLVGQTTVFVGIYSAVFEFYEPFEETAPGNTMDGERGWVAVPPGSAMVITNVRNDVYGGTNGLALGPGATMEHAFAGATLASEVWSEVYVQPVFRVGWSAPALSSNTTAAFYFDEGGLIVACDGPSVWRTFPGMTPVSAGSWVHVVIKQDYSAKTWMLLVDGSMLATDLGFYDSTRTEFTHWKSSGGDMGNAYLDDIRIGQLPLGSSALPFYEPFEPPDIALGTVHGQNGWVSDPEGSGVVQNVDVGFQTQSLEIRDATVSHVFSALNQRGIQTEMHVRPIWESAVAPPALPGGTTVGMYFDMSGYLMGYDGTGAGAWLRLSQSPCSPTNWLKISVEQDYDLQIWRAWVDDVLFSNILGFAETKGSFSAFEITAIGKTAALLDNLSISNQPNTHDITATATAGGTIAPSGVVPVTGGLNQLFTMAAVAGYRVEDVLVDGFSVGAVSSYTFSNVLADHAIHAVFGMTNTYTIVATVEGSGNISPAGMVVVFQGNDQQFDITPAPGYGIAAVLVDGVSQGPLATYTFTGVTADHTIVARFATGKAPNDFDGDGRTDLWRYDDVLGRWHIQPSSGLPKMTIDFTVPGGLPVTGDFDGDNFWDIGLYDPATGTWYIDFYATGIETQQFGWANATPVPADFDADGATDIAVYGSDWTWYIQGSSDGFMPIQFGWSGVVPVPADLDGDFKADPAVFHAWSGMWYALLSASGEIYAEQYGWNRPQPVYGGDFDGDGLADLALYDSTGYWYIWMTSDGFRQFHFGWTGAEPSIGDYDGDGITDVAIKTDNNWWYIIGSSVGPYAWQLQP